MASVSIYFLKNRILVCPVKKTTAGLGIESSPYIQLDPSVDALTLGNEIRRALDLSRETVPHPTDWAGLSKPRLAAAGVKSEKALMAQASLVQVRKNADGYHVSPTLNGGSVGSGRGFSARPDLKVSLAMDVTETELGEQVLKSVASCSVSGAT